MNEYGKKSQAVFNSCHPDIRLIFKRVLPNFDHSGLEGARLDETQYEYFKTGRSKLNGIEDRSKHQVTEEQPLSMAVDVSPYPIDFSDTHKALARFYMFSGYVFQASEELYAEGLITHKVRWGGDWDSDKNFEDQSFDDLVHFELVAV